MGFLGRSSNVTLDLGDPLGNLHREPILPFALVDSGDGIFMYDLTCIEVVSPDHGGITFSISQIIKEVMGISQKQKLEEVRGFVELLQELTLELPNIPLVCKEQVPTTWAELYKVYKPEMMATYPRRMTKVVDYGKLSKPPGFFESVSAAKKISEQQQQEGEAAAAAPEPATQAQQPRKQGQGITAFTTPLPNPLGAAGHQGHHQPRQSTRGTLVINLIWLMWNLDVLGDYYFEDLTSPDTRPRTDIPVCIPNPSHPTTFQTVDLRPGRAPKTSSPQGFQSASVIRSLKGLSLAKDAGEVPSETFMDCSDEPQGDAGIPAGADEEDHFADLARKTSGVGIRPAEVDRELASMHRSGLFTFDAVDPSLVYQTEEELLNKIRGIRRGR
jgi:hypothetical protein